MASGSPPSSGIISRVIPASSAADTSRARMRYGCGAMQVLPWPKKFATAGAIEEIEPGTVLVGIGDEPSELPGGLVKLDWASRALTKIEGPERKIREITATPDGRVFAASWWSLYEKKSGRVQ